MITDRQDAKIAKKKKGHYPSVSGSFWRRLGDLGVLAAPNGGSMRTLWPDLRFGARMLLKKPGFTMIVMLTLGLGIGANTAIFSVVNAVLLRALPYPQPERLAVLTEKRREGQRMGVAYPNYQDWRERAKSFAEMAGFRGALLNLTGVDKPAQLQS